MTGDGQDEGMSRQAIFEASVSYFLSPIGKFLEDASVTEVMVNRFDQVFIERAGRLHETEASFESEDALLSAVHNVAQWVGREINLENPILDARLPDGSRVHSGKRSQKLKKPLPKSRTTNNWLRWQRS